MHCYLRLPWQLQMAITPSAVYNKQSASVSASGHNRQADISEFSLNRETNKLKVIIMRG